MYQLVGRGDPSRQTSAQWLAVAYLWFTWNGEQRRFKAVMRSPVRSALRRMGRDFASGLSAESTTGLPPRWTHKDLFWRLR